MTEHRLSEMRHEDDQSFIKRVAPDLDKLEIIRKAKLKIYEFRKKIGIPLAVILTPPCAYIDWILLTMHHSGNDDNGAGVTAVVLGGLYMWVTKPRRDYAKAYKKDILPKLAATLGLTYDLKGKIPMSLLKPSRIVPRHDRYKSEDYFEGSYKDVALQFSEIKLQKKYRTKNGTRYRTIFKGLAILLEMDRKKFNGHTILQQNQSKFIEWFKEKSSGMQRANMVDPQFEKLFDAYTTDQVEARYLIDPKIIEEIKGISAEYEGKKMLVAYYDKHVLLMIATKVNHFEPANIYVKATDPISILGMKHEIVQILSLIDKLDLYDPYAVKTESKKAQAANSTKKQAAAPKADKAPADSMATSTEDDDGIPDGQIML